MKNLFLLTSFFALFLVACGSNDDKATRNIAIVDGYVNAVQQLDYNLMETFLADNYMGYGPSATDSISKADASASWKKNVEELYQKIDYKKSRSLAVSVEEGENQGDWVSNWAQLEITYKKGGEKVTVLTNTIYMIEGEKISKSFTFYNEADVLEQLGYVFINPDNL